MRPMLILSIALVVLAVALSIFVGAYGKAREERSELEKKLIESRADSEEVYSKYIDTKALLLVSNARIAELEAVEPSESAGIDLIFSETKSPEPEKRELFDVHTNVFRCMDFRKITNTESDQYALRQECMTRHNGIRALVIGDELYYCAALGNAFGCGLNSIGMAYSVTLRNGYNFNIVFAEFKHPIPQTPEELEAAKSDYGDPDYSYMSPKDENGEYIRDSLNVIEFVVDEYALPEKVAKAGTMTALDGFGGLYSYNGDIVSMEYIGRVWEREK